MRGTAVSVTPPVCVTRPDATASGRLGIAEIGALLRAKFARPMPF
jgi:hypothetical protein